MNTPVPLAGLNFPLQPGTRYRLSGYVRGGNPDASALISTGFDGATVESWGTVGVPSDWPPEDLPPASSDEKLFRFEGTWIGSGSLPSAITTPNGSFLIYQVWSYNPPLEVISANSSVSGGDVLMVGVLVLATGLLGLWLWMREESNTQRFAYPME